MKRLLAWWCLVLVLATTAIAEPQTAERVFVLEVWETPSGHCGTAFAVQYGGKTGVMTATHVVGIPGEPYQVKGAGESMSLIFTRIGATDVSFCETKVPEAWIILKMVGPAAKGEKVTLWGLPGVGGLVSSTGEVVARDEVAEHGISARGKWTRVSAPGFGGMSGGPVVNARREVFGVISGGRYKGNRIEAVVAEIPLPK